MIGVVADDITGANDIGAMFAEAGLETHVHTYTGAPFSPVGCPDVTVLDTDSRYCAAEEAYRRVNAATLDLTAAGCDRFFKKTCSVFRGNVGPEFDAMLDALGAESMIVVPGYPRNNRTTLHRIQYVFDRPLAESHFRNDPVHPMTSSDIVEILQRQTSRRVGHVDADVLARGVSAARVEMARLRQDSAYLLFDCPDAEALRTIAAAVRDERVFGGSAGLAGEVAPLWNPSATPVQGMPLPVVDNIGILVVAGSITPITERQVSALSIRGAVLLEMDVCRVLMDDGPAREVERLADAAETAMRAGRDAVLLTTTHPDEVASTLATARRQGISEAETGRRISDALGAATARILQRTNQNRILAAGGDTSAAVCKALGIRALRIGPVLEPGLPLCTGLTDRPVRLVLKGGSMGSVGFMVKALEALSAP